MSEKVSNDKRHETPQAWGDEVALLGPDAPRSDGSIKHLTEYLLTVHKRFGDTRVTYKGIQWGAAALWKSDEQEKRIEALEAELAALRNTPSASAEKDDVPLRCEVVDGAIQFTIGAKILAHATNICPTLYDAENDHGRYRVTAPVTFAKAVAYELNHEDEAGATLITRMLDEAIDDAINQGAEGVEENNDVRQYVGRSFAE